MFRAASISKHGPKYGRWYRFVLFASIATVLLGAGCGRMKSKDQISRFELANRTYQAALRWGEFGAAQEFLVMRDGSRPDAIDPAALEGLRVSRFELLRKLISDDSTEIIVRVKFDYYRNNSPVVKSVVDEQLWWYDATTGKWFIEGELPAFQ